MGAEQLRSNWLVVPGVVRIACVAVLHAIVQVKIGRSSQAFVIEAGQAEAFLEIFLEGMERFEVGGERGRGAACGRSPEHLEAAVHQQSDFIAEHEAGLVHARVLAGAIFDDGSDAIASDLSFTRAGWAGAEAQFS